MNDRSEWQEVLADLESMEQDAKRVLDEIRFRKFWARAILSPDEDGGDFDQALKESEERHLHDWREFYKRLGKECDAKLRNKETGLPGSLDAFIEWETRLQTERTFRALKAKGTPVLTYWRDRGRRQWSGTLFVGEKKYEVAQNEISVLVKLKKAGRRMKRADLAIEYVPDFGSETADTVAKALLSMRKKGLGFLFRKSRSSPAGGVGLNQEIEVFRLGKVQ